MTASFLLEMARAEPDRLLRSLESQYGGLTQDQATLRLKRFGTNEVGREKPPSALTRLWSGFKNPLVLLLMTLGGISYLTDDMASAGVILVMVILGVGLRFFQESRADHSAQKLRAMVHNTATVLRDGTQTDIPLQNVVPGDIVELASGDMVPADVRLLSAKDLFINQSTLTGEALPVEKTSLPASGNSLSPIDQPNLCFLGTNVESGSATAVVLETGDRTYLGSVAKRLTSQRQPTSFDRGMDKITWLMMGLIAVLVPIVFLIIGLTKHSWLDAFLFATAVAVGLTPELLPMIVTVNLSKGALAMARKDVIVKRLNSIQNFGAMDVLCTDKTGTLTQGKILLEKHIDPQGNPSEKVLQHAYLNSYHHTGLKNLLDDAILNHEELGVRLKPDERFRKIDEIPFNFVRRRMSVIVEDSTGLNTLLCKGAVDEVISLCTHVEIDGAAHPIQSALQEKHRQIADDLNRQGFRVIALAYKEMPNAPDTQVYSVKDEFDLTLLGYLAFLDPPKETAQEALQKLYYLGVDVKVLTGDNEIITTYLGKKVGLPAAPALVGSQIENMIDAELAEVVETTTLFARLAPVHKERIIRALQRKGHVVGFLGDGINDAPALKAADVGISVNSAVDIAKESSDIVLLQNSLLVLEQGVLEGRRVFGNIVKYIKMAASSNFGNMFSVVGASAFLPFLPMLPIQVLTNNLLYDFSQTTIPTDHVDEEWLKRPRQWTIGPILRFILFIGPISSLFDYLTFFILLFVFDGRHNPELFHTGWFVESLFTQVLIIHIIRTDKIPFIESRASLPLIVTSLVVVAIGAWLTVSPLAKPLGFVTLPGQYGLFLAFLLLGYGVLTQWAKTWFNRTFGSSVFRRESRYAAPAHV